MAKFWGSSVLRLGRGEAISAGGHVSTQSRPEMLFNPATWSSGISLPKLSWTPSCFTFMVPFQVSREQGQTWLMWLSGPGIILKLKRLPVHSRSEHMPGLWARSLAGDMWEEINQCFSCTLAFLSLSFSLPCPASKTRKYNLSSKRNTIFLKRERTGTNLPHSTPLLS